MSMLLSSGASACVQINGIARGCHAKHPCNVDDQIAHSEALVEDACPDLVVCSIEVTIVGIDEVAD